MLAWIQRLLVLAQLAALAGWLAWADRQGLGGLATAAGALAVLALQGGILALDFWLLSRIDPGPSRATLRRAWWHEWGTALRVFSWRQPFRADQYPDLLPAPGAAPGQPSLLLVHGFFCNRGLWNPWLARLHARGLPFVAVNLEPVFGSVDDHVQTLADAHDRLLAATGRPPLIVAHSMGGLAVRAWLALRPPAEPPQVITLGTPHHGTWMARFGRALNNRQMRVKSEWLLALAPREAVAHRGQYTCWYSDCDNIVFPTRGATLDGADNRLLPGVGHVDLVFQPEVWRDVLQRLTPPASA